MSTENHDAPAIAGGTMLRSAVTTAELSALMDRSPDTIARWGNTERAFRAAKWKRGWWKLQPLIDAGLLKLPNR